MAIFGGLVADRVLGQYRSALTGGVVIALGHFALAFKALPFFYGGLSLIAIGTGFAIGEPMLSAVTGTYLASSFFYSARGKHIPYLEMVLVASGFEPVLDSGPEEARQFIAAETARWLPIMQAANFKLE